MLTPSMVSMMSNDHRCFVCGQTGHTGLHCPNAHHYSCDEFGHFLHQEHHATKTGLIQGHYTPTPNGTYHTPLTIGTDMGETFQLITIMPLFPLQQEQHQFQKAHIMLPIHPLQWLPLADGCPHCHSHHDTPHRHSHTHPTLTTSPIDVIHATIPWTTVNLTLATLTTPHGEHS